MTNTRKILIVDDDSELREALVEQLALLEEFESIAVDNGTKAVQTAKAGQIDLLAGEPQARGPGRLQASHQCAAHEAPGADDDGPFRKGRALIEVLQHG